VDTRDRQPSTGKKQMSFEELLKEFTEGPSQEVVEQKIEEPHYDEVKYHDDDEIQKIYNKSIAQTKKYNDKFDAEEHDERHSGNFSHFKGYAEDEEEEESEYAALLQDGESAKRAIILGEILNRKY
jgi:hypothetical protein